MKTISGPTLSLRIPWENVRSATRAHVLFCDDILNLTFLFTMSSHGKQYGGDLQLLQRGLWAWGGEVTAGEGRHGRATKMYLACSGRWKHYVEKRDFHIRLCDLWIYIVHTWGMSAKREGKQALTLGLFKWTCQWVFVKMLFVCVLSLKCSLKELETVDITCSRSTTLCTDSRMITDRPSQRLNVVCLFFYAVWIILFHFYFLKNTMTIP